MGYATRTIGRFYFVRAVAAMMLVLVGATLTLTSAAQDRPRTKVLVVDVTGVIGVATTLHVQKGIDQARGENAEALILRVNTPGGLVSSTREIVEAILASPVPVVGFVAPSGAHAASGVGSGTNRGGGSPRLRATTAW